MRGDPLTIMDAARYTVLERWSGEGKGADSSFIDKPGNRLFVGRNDNSIEVFELEPSGCQPTVADGLAMLYSGDGSLHDAVGMTELRASKGLGAN